MKTLLSPVREALATPSSEAMPSASPIVAAAKAVLQAGAATPAEHDVAAANPQAGMNSGLIDSLPGSKLDALRTQSQNASAPVAQLRNELDTRFKLRDLTLPYSAFDSARPGSLADSEIVSPGKKQLEFGKRAGLPADARELLGGSKGRDILGQGGFDFKVPGSGGPDGPDIDPRANDGDMDGLGRMTGFKDRLFPGGVVLPGGVVPGGDPDNNPRAGGDGDGDGTGRQPGGVGSHGPRGDAASIFGDFHAFDIDDIMPQYRDPDLNPRAQDGSCGSTGCGTTNTPDCGSTSCGQTDSCGSTSCGATNSCGQTDSCGTTSCGNTGSCGSTSCGSTNSCGTTSCGDTHACGTTNSPGFDPAELFSRSELLRQQFLAELVVVNAKQLR